MSAEMYSAPSIVLQSRGADGSVHVFDDFRESYAWLRQNTAEDSKVRPLGLGPLACFTSQPFLFGTRGIFLTKFCCSMCFFSF